MAKLRLLILVSGFLFPALPLVAQQYQLSVRAVDHDSASLAALGFVSSFNNRNDCVKFVTGLPALLSARGYVTSSIDSINYDSASARMVLYLGSRYEWSQLDVSAVDPLVLEAVGW